MLYIANVDLSTVLNIDFIGDYQIMIEWKTFT